MATKQKELGKGENSNFEQLPSVAMLQPERFLQNDINNQYTLSSQQMLGLTAEEVQKLFGVPSFKHYNPPAEIWQYRKDSCLLDFFLYVDKNQSRSLRVKHVEVRGRNINNISQKKCFLQVLRTKP